MLIKLLKYASLVVFSVAHGTAFAQELGEPMYELTVNGNVGHAGSSRCGNGYWNRGLNSLALKFANGEGRIFFQENIDDNRPFESKVLYSELDEVVSLEIYSGYRIRSSRGCRNKQAWDYIEISNGCSLISFDTHDFYTYEHAKITGEIDIRPIINLARSTDETDMAGYENPLTVLATEGFASDIYKWQYKIEGEDDWIDIERQSPVQYPHILEFTPQHYLPLSTIGKRINFRILPCEGKPSENVVSYLLRRSAPHLNGLFITDVSCYDGSDGSVKLTFDRPLEEDDNFNISIVDLSTEVGRDGDIILYAPVKALENLTAGDLDENNSITLDGLQPSNPDFGYRIDLLGAYNGENYYTGDASHSATFNIRRPTDPVDFEIRRVINDWCNDDDGDPETHNDGEIHLLAYGGRVGDYEFKILESDKDNSETDTFQDRDWETESEWVAFESTFNHEIKGLKPNVNYGIKVRIKLRNGVYCYAKNQEVLEDGPIGLGEEKILTTILTQPERKLQVEYVHYKEPLAFGYKDGVIKAKIWGGTPNADGQYNVEWKNNDNEILDISNVEIVNEVDEGGKSYKANILTLEGIPTGYYYLTVYDNNHEPAIDRQGCYVNNSEYFLDEPEELLVEIIETEHISCNSENIYSDPYSDGELTATARGGVQLGTTDNRGLPYYYEWSKKDNGGEWELLGNEIDSVLTGITAGEYRVIITDANEITTEQSYTIAQPDLLKITYTKTDLDCDYENKGSISISVTGGVPGYDIQWSNGETTPQIQDLAAGTYMVYVTDSRGCQAIEEITIEQPEDISIQVLEQRAPTCFEGNDGAIYVEVTGGTAPYTYVWNTGGTNPFITDIPQGTYELKITDAKGCVARTEYTLKDPAALTINLGEDRTICIDQGIIYDITIDDPGAIYKWESDNGFSSTSPIVELTERGNYKATVITSQGCEGTDELTVNVSDKEIDAYFLLTTQAFAREEVVLVNVSEFLGESVEWTVPAGVEKVFSDKEGLIVYFEEPGSYEINLRSYQGNCYQDYTKKIIVEEAADLSYAVSDPGFINEFIVYPNPTDGEFKVKVSLAEAADISIKIISLTTSSVMHSRTGKSTKEYLLDYNLDLVPGMYIMLLETPQGKEIRKMIFN